MTLLASLPVLGQKLAANDLVLCRIIAVVQSQTLGAQVEEVYSAKHGVPADCAGSAIEFVHAPGSWGAVPLTVGDRALVLLRQISGKLYEDAWQGHLLIEEINSSDHVIFPLPELWRSAEVPDALRAAAVQDPKQPKATAIRFEAVQAFLWQHGQAARPALEFQSRASRRKRTSKRTRR